MPAARHPANESGATRASPALATLSGLLLLSLTLGTSPSTSLRNAADDLESFWARSHLELSQQPYMASAPRRGNDDEEDYEEDGTLEMGLKACADVHVAPTEAGAPENHAAKDDSDCVAIEQASSSDGAAAAPRAICPPRAPALGEDVLAHAVQFLTLRDMDTARKLGGALARAVEWTSVVPDFGPDGLLFTKWLEHPPPKPVVPNAPPTPFWWRCAACCGYSNHHQACIRCRQPVETAACRVFLGQLPKRCTAAAVDHLLRVVAPEVRPLHVESHSNRAGYEKGCAWAYLNSLEDCAALLRLNKRVFFDEDADRTPGFWLLRQEGYTDVLERFAELRNQEPRSVTLPRRPLVAELPSDSRLPLAGIDPLQYHTSTPLPR